MISCGFNPSDWFVPSASQLQNPGYICRANWDNISGLCAVRYWASTECSPILGGYVCFLNGNAASDNKATIYNLRAFRCVTY
jgi:hypothetical protein